MGCSASRFEVTNGTTFLQRLEAIKGRRRPLKHPTTLSKKQLLSHCDDVKFSVSSRPPYSLEDIITSTSKATPDQEIKFEAKGSTVGIAIIIAANNKPIVTKDDGNKETHKKVKFVGINEDEDDDDDDERRIGYDDGEAFPRSPSFRVYFEDHREHSHNETVKYGDVFPEIVTTGDIVPPKVRLHVEKKVKRERKKRCFRKVLPKRGSQADVKRILNIKSCYS